ncbi:MAG: pseudouridine synthase [Flavitalea sp.]
MSQYYIIYKPFQVLTQFSASEGKKTLKDFFKVPSDVYPVGRLDFDSEGLLVLTNDNILKHKLTDPASEHEKEYWVQVEGEINEEAIIKLKAGVTISVDGKSYRTKPANAQIISPEPKVHFRNPPIRFRMNIPTSWISLSITEGKNRQVRKMTAAVGFPTLRLIRHRIGSLHLGDMKPGEMLELSRAEVYG